MTPNQSQTANDISKCRICNFENNVTIVVDNKENFWQCKNCRAVQKWKPSDQFKQATGIVSKVKGGIQKMLFTVNPLVLGVVPSFIDGPDNFRGVVMCAIALALIAISIEHYRVKTKKP